MKNEELDTQNQYSFSILNTNIRIKKDKLFAAILRKNK